MRAAEEALRQDITLAELDVRLSRLTWCEIGLGVERPKPLGGGAGRRRNRFAALRPDIAASYASLSRVTRVRAVTYLVGEVRALRADLAAKRPLTVTQLTRVRWLFGSHPGPLRNYFASSAGSSDQGSSAMGDALAIEEGFLGETLKMVRRVPDPVPRLTVEQLCGLSTRQLLQRLAATRREERKEFLLLALAALYETNPPA